MDEKQLRELIREEVERVLDEELVVDSHPKFRRLVEARVGRPFHDSDEGWTTTYEAWTAALQESGGTKVDKETLDYYVEAVLETFKA